MGGVGAQGYKCKSLTETRKACEGQNCAASGKFAHQAARNRCGSFSELRKRLFFCFRTSEKPQILNPSLDWGRFSGIQVQTVALMDHHILWR